MGRRMLVQRIWVREEEAGRSRSVRQEREGERKGSRLIHVLGIIFLFLRGKKD